MKFIQAGLNPFSCFQIPNIMKESIENYKITIYMSNKNAVAAFENLLIFLTGFLLYEKRNTLELSPYNPIIIICSQGDAPSIRSVN